MGCVELTGFFPGIGGKHANEILIDKAQDIVVLLTVHRDFIDKTNEITDSLGLFTGSCA